MRSAAIMGAMIGLPTVATYLHNTRAFPEVYEDIPDFEKQNNYMLIMGDAKDARGRFTQLYKIPKGDVGRFFGNPIENYLAFLDGFNAQAVDDLAVDLLSDISPLPFAREGDVDFLRIATAVPPAIRGIAEGAFNVNFFTGRPIVPRRLQTVSPRKQFRPDTPKWAVELGNLLNMSPLKLINFVGVQFAGVGRQLADPERAGESITRRFRGAASGAREDRSFESLDKLTLFHADERLDTRRATQRLYDKIQAMPEAQREPFFRRQLESGAMSPEQFQALAELASGIAAGLTNFERKLKSTALVPRARFMFDELQKLRLKEQGERMREWEDKRILTDGARDELAKLARELANPTKAAP